MTKRLCVTMAALILDARLPVGRSVASGLMDQPPGRALLTLRIHILFRLQNTQNL